MLLLILTQSLRVGITGENKSTPSEVPSEQKKTPAKSGPGQLSKKMPFEYLPKVGPHSRLLSILYIQFETKEGSDPILAKAFLTGTQPPKVPGRNSASRIFATGIEIEPPVRPPTESFVPDFVVDKQFVDRIPKTSSYSVNLGDVKFRIATTRAP